jgi:hypothetical protein
VIGPGEIQRSLTAAWQIFLGRPDAMRAFDTSNDGFWRSFQAIVLIAPLYALTAIADWRASLAAVLPDGELPFSAGAFWTSKVILLGLDWVTLPILLVALAGFLGIKQRYAAYIVARNWSTVVAVAPFGAVALLDLLGLLPGDAVLIPSLVALVFALRLSYMVARTALAAPVEIAVGYVVFDFLVSLALVRIVGRLLGVEPI